MDDHTSNDSVGERQQRHRQSRMAMMLRYVQQYSPPTATTASTTTTAATTAMTAETTAMTTPTTMSYAESLTYFTQEAIRAGYVAPRFENRVGPIQHQPANMHEAIWRDIEKQQIREEIIAEDIVRRRSLELEVRREMMVERQLMQQSGEGFSPFSSPVFSFSPTFPFLMQPRSVSGLGAIAPFEERISEIPFQKRSVEPKISALKPESHTAEPMISELQSSLEPSKEKDEIIFLDKPNTSLSGVKRKADTPPVEVDSQPLSLVPKKNGKEDWSCALCQVSATSERGLNDHLQGKKHKSKEAALRIQKNGKNFSIGLFPKKPKTINILEANNNLSIVPVVKPNVELLPYDKSGEGSSLVISEKEGAKNVSPSLHHHDGDLKKNVNAAQKKQKNKKYKFWCATCKVGAMSEVSMEDHRIGKRHKARLLQLSSIATSGAKVENTQTVNEASEDVGETEVIDDASAIVDKINPEEQEEVSTGDD